MFYEDVLLAACKWKAAFIGVKSHEKAADLINAPHEDYPRRVPKTLELIKELTSHEEQLPITKGLIQNIHYQLFTGELEESDIRPGFWRYHSVGFDDQQYVPPRAYSHRRFDR